MSSRSHAAVDVLRGAEKLVRSRRFPCPAEILPVEKKNIYVWKRIRYWTNTFPGGIQNPNADPLALGSHASGTKLALKAR